MNTKLKDFNANNVDEALTCDCGGILSAIECQRKRAMAELHAALRDLELQFCSSSVLSEFLFLGAPSSDLYDS